MRLDVGTIKVFYMDVPSPRFDVHAALPGNLTGEQVLDILDSVLRFAQSAMEEAKRTHNLPDWKSAAVEIVNSEYISPELKTDD